MNVVAGQWETTIPGETMEQTVELLKYFQGIAFQLLPVHSCDIASLTVCVTGTAGSESEGGLLMYNVASWAVCFCPY